MRKAAKKKTTKKTRTSKPKAKAKGKKTGGSKTTRKKASKKVAKKTAPKKAARKGTGPSVKGKQILLFVACKGQHLYFLSEKGRYETLPKAATVIDRTMAFLNKKCREGDSITGDPSDWVKLTKRIGFKAITSFPKGGIRCVWKIHPINASYGVYPWNGVAPQGLDKESIKSAFGRPHAIWKLTTPCANVEETAAPPVLTLGNASVLNAIWPS